MEAARKTRSRSGVLKISSISRFDQSCRVTEEELAIVSGGVATVAKVRWETLVSLDDVARMRNMEEQDKGKGGHESNAEI